MGRVEAKPTDALYVRHIVGVDGSTPFRQSNTPITNRVTKELAMNLVADPSNNSPSHNTRIIKSYVERLFKDAPDRNNQSRRNPVTAAGFVNGKDPIAPQKRKAHRALLAREWFYVFGPHDAPPLPLSHWEIQDMRYGTYKFGATRAAFYHLIANYAVSLSGEGYDFNIHPSFEDYASSVLASDYAPNILKNDEELCNRYPPRNLCTIGPGLCWEPPKVNESNRRSSS
jgi:hypothetical protein